MGASRGTRGCSTRSPFSMRTPDHSATPCGTPVAPSSVVAAKTLPQLGDADHGCARRGVGRARGGDRLIQGNESAGATGRRAPLRRGGPLVGGMARGYCCATGPWIGKPQLGCWPLEMSVCWLPPLAPAARIVGIWPVAMKAMLEPSGDHDGSRCALPSVVLTLWTTFTENASAQ